MDSDQESKCKDEMEVVAVIILMLLGGVTAEWSSTNLVTVCEDDIQPYPCPGDPCEQCTSCITEYVYQCKCLPAVILAQYPNPDGFSICFWLWANWGITGLPCCESYKELMKRYSISQESGESVNPFSGILLGNSDTHKRDNGKAGNSTTTENGDGSQSSTVLSDTNTPVQPSETDGNESGADTDEDDLKNVDITDNNACGKTTAGNSETTKEGSENGTETQDENRTGSGSSASNNDNKDSDKDTGHTDGTHTKGRKRRDNLLMRALLLARDIWKHMHDKHRVKY